MQARITQKFFFFKFSSSSHTYIPKKKKNECGDRKEDEEIGESATNFQFQSHRYKTKNPIQLRNDRSKKSKI